MNDAELIEAAARAIGKVGKYDERWEGFKSPVLDGEFADEGASDGGAYTFWNPLKNDDEAFRLAVKLRMIVSLADCCCCAVVDWASNEDDNEIRVRFGEDFADRECDDAATATRRAIVRAAAALTPKEAP